MSVIYHKQIGQTALESVSCTRIKVSRSQLYERTPNVSITYGELQESMRGL